MVPKAAIGPVYGMTLPMRISEPGALGPPNAGHIGVATAIAAATAVPANVHIKRPPASELRFGLARQEVAFRARITSRRAQKKRRTRRRFPENGSKVDL